jgi:hypothetical protein
MEYQTIPHLRIAAILLIAGWVMFWAGAFTPPYRWWMGIPVKEYLELIAAHKWTWIWIAGSFAVGVLLTLAGLIVLGTVLQAGGERFWTALGQSAFLFGSLLWLASIAFRATATVSAAEETAATGLVPSWFEPMRMWSTAMFAVYMVLAYLAIAAYGKALFAVEVAPAWVAWMHVVFGLAGAVGFIVRFPLFDPPLMIHLVPGILGVVLLMRSSSG